MKKIKILYTIPNFDTCATGYAMLQLALRLDKTKFDPEIVCLHNKGALFQQVLASKIPVFIFPYLSPLKPRWKLFLNIFRIARFFKSRKPDIIFSYHYGSDFSEALAAKFSGAKFVYIKKNMGWKGPSYNQWKFKTFLSDAITVQNTDMMNDFFPNMEKAHLISLGVDTDLYVRKKGNLALKTSLFIPSEAKIIICVANIIPKKGIDYLLRGYAELVDAANTRLIIVGDYENELGLEMIEFAKTLNISERVLFTGKRFDVPDLLNISTVFILPSTGNEGAPVAIQEAMSTGVPVITTDTPGNRDQLRELPNQLIPPSDHSAIAQKLKYMLDLSDEDREIIIAKQLEIVKSRYSLTEEVKRHEALYQSLISRKS